MPAPKSSFNSPKAGSHFPKPVNKDINIGTKAVCSSVDNAGTVSSSHAVVLNAQEDTPTQAPEHVKSAWSAVVTLNPRALNHDDDNDDGTLKAAAGNVRKSSDGGIMNKVNNVSPGQTTDMRKADPGAVSDRGRKRGRPRSSKKKKSEKPEAGPAASVVRDELPEFDDEDTDFILYLTLQNMDPQAVGVELHRLNRQRQTRQYAVGKMSVDKSARALSTSVVGWLQSCRKSQPGTDEEAKRVVCDLVMRGASLGWSAGSSVRARAYSRTLVHGKALSQDWESRRYEAKCRRALSKWRSLYPHVEPQQVARPGLEKLAFQGKVLRDTQQGSPDRELMKRNLLKLWEHGFVESGATVE